MVSTHCSTDFTEICVIPRTLVGIALIAEGLKVRRIICSAVTAREDMVHFKRPLISRNTTQLAPEPCPF
jgi:hypothetical protein